MNTAGAGNSCSFFVQKKVYVVITTYKTKKNGYASIRKAKGTKKIRRKYHELRKMERESCGVQDD